MQGIDSKTIEEALASGEINFATNALSSALDNPEMADEAANAICLLMIKVVGRTSDNLHNLQKGAK